MSRNILFSDQHKKLVVVTIVADIPLARLKINVDMSD